MIHKKIKIDKLISFIPIVITTIVIGATGVYALKILVKKNMEYEFFRRTKCINNELFYKKHYKDKNYIKQNQKCTVVEGKIYIYENGDLRKLEMKNIENNIEILEIEKLEEREVK